MTPTGVSPWVDVLFTDTAPGKVSVTVSTPGLVGNEYVAGLYLNLNPALSPGNLSFTVLGSSGGFALPSVSTGKDKFKATGDGKYDVFLKFSQKTSKTFSGNEYITYEITSSSAGFDADDFQYLSKPAGGAGPFLAAAEILGICETPGMIAPCNITPVPEPSPVVMLGLGLGLLVGVRRILRGNRAAQRV
jgi:hypothetical protein